MGGRRLVNPIETLSRDTLILTNEISMLLHVSPTVKTSEFIFTPRWFSKSTIVRGGQFYFLIWRKLFFFFLRTLYLYVYLSKLLLKFLKSRLPPSISFIRLSKSGQRDNKANIKLCQIMWSIKRLNLTTCVELSNCSSSIYTFLKIIVIGVKMDPLVILTRCFQSKTY